jgi:hypothetical protein
MKEYGTHKTTVRYKYYATAAALCGAGTVLAYAYAHPAVAAVGTGVTIAATFGALRELTAEMANCVTDHIYGVASTIIINVQDEARRPAPVDSPRGEQLSPKG